MSRITMAVEVLNESRLPLVWERDEIVSGGWTDPWYPSRPARIEPGARAVWQAEGDLFLAPTSGAEGRVWYRVDGDPGRQLYVHFNSPLIESQYSNTFHVWAPPGFEADHSGGQGHQARLTIRFREAEPRAVPGFTHTDSGLPFTNADWASGLEVITVGHLWNRLRDELGGAAEVLGIPQVDDGWLPITEAAAGMCGGMAYAAMDYYAAGTLPPTAERPKSSQDPLFPYLRDRLIDSWGIGGTGYRWLAYSSPHYPDGDEGFLQAAGLARGRAWVAYREEWPQIRADIEAGNPSPLALVQTDSLDIGRNHQIVAYAYEQSGQQVTLWVYDPNVPAGHEPRLQFDLTDTAGPVDVTRVGYPTPPAEGYPRIQCFFRSGHYNPHSPPGGRPLTVRQALRRVTGRSYGRIPDDIGLAPPVSVRSWIASL